MSHEATIVFKGRYMLVDCFEFSLLMGTVRRVLEADADLVSCSPGMGRLLSAIKEHHMDGKGLTYSRLLLDSKIQTEIDREAFLNVIARCLLDIGWGEGGPAVVELSKYLVGFTEEQDDEARQRCCCAIICRRFLWE
jgi:hypothetical protein